MQSRARRRTQQFVRRVKEGFSANRGEGGVPETVINREADLDRRLAEQREALAREEVETARQRAQVELLRRRIEEGR